MLLAVISIHALREEGDVQAGTVLGASGPISIHALREEGDRRVVPLFGLTLYFYPRPPRGGRPAGFQQIAVFCGISIHALREEGDAQ